MEHAQQVEEFWRILAAATAHGPDNDGLADAIEHELARLPIPRIARFQRTLMHLCDRALTWDLWRAADIVFHPLGASEDDFVYFRLWLIGQGRGTFSRAVLRPDSLAEIPAIQRFAAGDRGNDNYPWMEELMYAAEAAYDQVLEKLGPAAAERLERPDDLSLRPREIPGPAWPKQPAHYPRLATLFQTAA
jgi:hypothetical protein